MLKMKNSLCLSRAALIFRGLPRQAHNTAKLRLEVRHRQNRISSAFRRQRRHRVHYRTRRDHRRKTLLLFEDRSATIQIDCSFVLSVGYDVAANTRLCLIKKMKPASKK